MGKSEKIGTSLEAKPALLKYIKFCERSKQGLNSIHFHKGEREYTTDSTDLSIS